MVSELALVFMIGFLGSAHCIGMCGGFVVALGHAQAWRGVVHQGVYLAGKTVTYALLGAVVGGGGAVLIGGLTGFQDALSFVVGGILIGIGLGLLGAWRRFTWLHRRFRLPGLQPALTFFLRRRHYGGAFGLGLVNGFLPCGLVYALLARATATGHAWSGALLMAVFGLSTVPALLFTGFLGNRLTPRHRHRLNQISGLFVVWLGLLTVLRGTSWLPAWMPGAFGHGWMH